MDRWSSRVALVTGASSGIGAALVEALVKRGMVVAGCSRNPQKIQELSEKLKAEKGKLHAYKCDVGKEEDVLRLFSDIKKNHGGVDVCVNNAGVVIDAPILTAETSAMSEMLQTNVLGLCMCTREAFNSMKEKCVDDGHIINISSYSGHRLVSGGGNSNFYGATKHAVRAITEGIRMELRNIKSHIRVTEISPGMVETEIWYKDGIEKAQQLFKSMKLLQPEDIVDAIIYVLSAPPHVQVHDILMRPTEQVP